MISDVKYIHSRKIFTRKRNVYVMSQNGNVTSSKKK